MKGVICVVYRPAVQSPDHTGVISDQVGRVLLVGDGLTKDQASGHFILYLQQGETHLYASLRKNPERCRFGGNFLFSIDEEFPSKQPIPIYDKILSPILTRHLGYCGDDE